MKSHMDIADCVDINIRICKDTITDIITDYIENVDNCLWSFKDKDAEEEFYDSVEEAIKDRIRDRVQGGKFQLPLNDIIELDIKELVDTFYGGGWFVLEKEEEEDEEKNEKEEK